MRYSLFLKKPVVPFELNEVFSGTSNQVMDNVCFKHQGPSCLHQCCHKLLKLDNPQGPNWNLNGSKRTKMPFHAQYAFIPESKLGFPFPNTKDYGIHNKQTEISQI